MRPFLALSSFGAIALLLLAVFSLPARILPYFIDSQALRLSGFSGTLLQGSAARAIVATPAGYLHLGELDWELRPLSLLRLSPSVDLSSEWGSQRITLRASGGKDKLSLRDVDINVSASLLRQLLPLELDGRLSLVLDTLKISSGRIDVVEGRFLWRSAVWPTPAGVRPLGDYLAILSSPSPGAVDADVETLAGPVIAEGSLSLVRQDYAVDLTVRGREGALVGEVAHALSLIASPVENGYRLRLDGELSAFGQ